MKYGLDGPRLPLVSCVYFLKALHKCSKNCSPLLVKHHTWKAVLLQEGDPYQELREGSCLTLGNELSEDTHVLKKQKPL